MAKKIYDIAVKTSEYTDNTGAKKGRWQNVGAVMLSDDGSKFLMLSKWFNPAGVPDFSGRNSESLLLSLFEPKAQDAPPAAAPQAVRQNAASTAAKIDDDLPF
ncbi:hypothetical protein [Caudoviricetes sp.]|jgi:hypothetical protein|nr:hypothetical protein [Caudoviricetes sp.]